MILRVSSACVRVCVARLRVVPTLLPYVCVNASGVCMLNVSGSLCWTVSDCYFFAPFTVGDDGTVS